MPAIVRVIASPSSWIEGESLRQLERSAALAGVFLSVVGDLTMAGVARVIAVLEPLITYKRGG